MNVGNVSKAHRNIITEKGKKDRKNWTKNQCSSVR